MGQHQNLTDSSVAQNKPISPAFSPALWDSTQPKEENYLEIIGSCQKTLKTLLRFQTCSSEICCGNSAAGAPSCTLWDAPDLRFTIYARLAGLPCMVLPPVAQVSKLLCR